MDAGVRVVMAHCASIGEDIDLDKGKHGPHVPSIELFSRLMADANYQQNLFGDIAAIVMRKPFNSNSARHHRTSGLASQAAKRFRLSVAGVLPLFTTASWPGRDCWIKLPCQCWMKYSSTTAAV